jgi:hypothetical protein
MWRRPVIYDSSRLRSRTDLCPLLPSRVILFWIHVLEPVQLERPPSCLAGVSQALS